MTSYRSALVLSLLAFVVSGFAPFPESSSSSRPRTQLDALSRRQALVAASVLAFPSLPAQASYSAYTAREKDWADRQAKGEVQYSSARSLRSQLREMVPENNDAKSKVFCPNGPSSAVSPLMENKCSDTLTALPSVYGRTQDVAGNSIPGFKGGYYAVDSSSSITINSVGGFPQYGK